MLQRYYTITSLMICFSSVSAMETKCPKQIADAEEFKQYKEPSTYGARALFHLYKLVRHKNNPKRSSNQAREGQMYVDASTRQLSMTESDTPNS